MNRKFIKYMVASLVLIGCLPTFSKTAVVDAISYYGNSLESSISYANNDNVEKNRDGKKHKEFNAFSEDNFKYISSDQKKQLLELKKCKDRGEELSDDQKKTLLEITDCIIKGKLGDKEYEDFKHLMEKKKSNEKLTDEEDKKLKDYRDIIDGSKLSNKDILNQFLR